MSVEASPKFLNEDIRLIDGIAVNYSDNPYTIVVRDLNHQQWKKHAHLVDRYFTTAKPKHLNRLVKYLANIDQLHAFAVVVFGMETLKRKVGADAFEAIYETLDGLKPYYYGYLDMHVGGVWECKTCGHNNASAIRFNLESIERFAIDLENKICDKCSTSKSLAVMPYQKYLQTPHWKQMRQLALDYAGYACQVCNASGVTLDVHHRTYERRGREDIADLTVLCRKCHSLFHGKGV